MQDELSFNIDRTLISNLERLTGEESLVSEQRLMELYDVAYDLARIAVRMLRDGLSHSDVLECFDGNVDLGTYSVSPLVHQDDRAQLERLSAGLSVIDRIFLAELYVSVLASTDFAVREGDLFKTEELPETFTYVRNVLSDEAYDVFSSDFHDPRVMYSPSFRECVAMVGDGRASYCLLPLEERGGVRLPTVSELILRNDLKINAVIPVFGTDGNADMKYALLSRSFTVPATGKDDDRYIELRLDAESNASLAHLFTAVEYFGMRVYSVNTVRLGTEELENKYFTVVIKDGGTGFAPLLVFLEIYGSDFLTVGMYKNLE